MSTPLTVPDDLMDNTVVWECSHPDCRERSTIAMIFHKQPGHVHYCAHHGGIALAYFDVADSYLMPCPWKHGNGATWTANPRERT